jgi:hypothetical protein
LIRFGHRNEQGITHLLTMAAGVGVLVVVLVAGLLVFQHGKHKAGVIGVITPFDTCLRSNANDNNICNFEKHYVAVNQTAYTASVTVTSPQGTISDLTYSSDGNGDSQVVGSSDGQQLSSIVIGGATYIKVSGSDWIEYPNNATSAPAQTDPTASMDIAVGEPDLSFQYVDTETCGNLTCYKYAVTDSAQPNITQDIWFDTTSYKLREWSYHGTTGSTAMTITYQPVTITAPAPVKVV